MPHGVDRSCVGTIERVFSTTRQFGIHRQGLSRARGRFRWRKFWLISAACLTVFAIAAFAAIVLSGTPLDQINKFYWGGGIILWVFTVLFGAFGSILDAKQDASIDFNDLAALHDALPPIAWEVRLESGENVILKGFSGRRGDQIGVNFIGDWTPSIVNLSEDPTREQRSLEFEKSNPNALFFSSDDYHRFVEGEKYRLNEFELRVSKNTSLTST